MLVGFLVFAGIYVSTAAAIAWLVSRKGEDSFWAFFGLYLIAGPLYLLMRISKWIKNIRACL